MESFAHPLPPAPCGHPTHLLIKFLANQKTSCLGPQGGSKCMCVTVQCFMVYVYSCGPRHRFAVWKKSCWFMNRRTWSQTSKVWVIWKNETFVGAIFFPSIIVCHTNSMDHWIYLEQLIIFLQFTKKFESLFLALDNFDTRQHTHLIMSPEQCEMHIPSAVFRVTAYVFWSHLLFVHLLVLARSCFSQMKWRARTLPDSFVVSCEIENQDIWKHPKTNRVCKETTETLSQLTWTRTGTVWNENLFSLQ